MHSRTPQSRSNTHGRLVLVPMVFSSLIVLNAATGSAFTAVPAKPKSPGRAGRQQSITGGPSEILNVKLEDAKLGR